MHMSIPVQKWNSPQGGKVHYADAVRKHQMAAAGLQLSAVNPLMGTLKPHSNGPLYSSTVIGIHWLLMGGLLHLVQ